MLLKQVKIESEGQVEAEVQECHWFCAVAWWCLSVWNKRFNKLVITMLLQRLCGYGHVWIKINSTTQLLSSSALSQPPTPRRPGHEGLHTFGDDFSCKPFITPFRRPCQQHSHKETERRPEAHTLMHAHAHTHTCTLTCLLPGSCLAGTSSVFSSFSLPTVT